jgi:hypothetical protein
MTKEHIIYTLGINVPTLTESLNGNKSSLQLILEEQMLYESFLDSVKTYAKEKWDKAITTIKDWKDTAAAIGKVITSGDISSLAGAVFRYGIKQPLKSLKDLLDKVKLSNLYTEYVLPVINKISQLTGWKGFIVFLSIGSIIKYITSKLSNLSAEGIKKWILAYFSDEIIGKITSKLTDFSSFVGWLQPIIKGTEIIFDILKPSLDRLNREDPFSTLSPTTESYNTYNKNKMKNKALKQIIKEEIKNILLENEPALKGTANLKPLIAQLPGVDIAQFTAAYNALKAGRKFSMEQTKAMANAMAGLIQSDDDQLLVKIMTQLKNIEGK